MGQSSAGSPIGLFLGCAQSRLTLLSLTWVAFSVGWGSLASASFTETQ